MSVAAVTWAFEVVAPPTQKLVLLCLADHADADGRCWPSVARISARTGLKERAIQLALRDLKGREAFTADVREGIRTTYQLAIGKVLAPTEPPQEMRPRTKRTGAGDAGEGRTICGGGAQQMRGTPAADAPEPTKNHQEPSGNRQFSISADFDAFWAAYPRKVGKDAARRKWDAARKRHTVADIMAGLARQQWPADPQFVPHPATWLNGGRWQDDPGAAAPLPVLQTKPSSMAWMFEEDSNDIAGPIIDHMPGGFH